MTRITVAPEWEWWLVWYFFLGGLAAGLYFMAALIELVGSERDRAMAKVAYYYAFPLAVVCGCCSFWTWDARSASGTCSSNPKLAARCSSTGRPCQLGHGRSWSSAAWHSCRLWVCWRKMDAPGWGAGVLWPALYTAGRSGKLFALLCAGVGFFLASYTGVLLAATNQPFWSDTRLLGGLFLASAAATGTALMLLLRLPSAAPASLARLQRVNSWALGLELCCSLGFSFRWVGWRCRSSRVLMAGSSSW